MTHRSTVLVLRHGLALAAALWSSTFAGPASAAGPNAGGGAVGVVSIDQDKAEAGSVTVGDTPGFPILITQSGSYRLTSNLVVSDATKTAIAINADGVTLDLNGFTIRGQTTCSGTPVVCIGSGSGDGVIVNLPVLNQRASVTIANGSIRGMGRYAINSPNNNDTVRVERIMAVNNGSDGLHILGGAVVVDSQIAYNGRHGIYGSAVVLLNNLFRANAGTGVYLNSSSVGAGNVVQGHAINVSTSPAGMKNMGPNWCGAALCL
jgi:hypothetical protein